MAPQVTLKEELAASRDAGGRLWPDAALRDKASKAIALLRAQRLSCAAIAERLGIGAATAVRWDVTEGKVRAPRVKRARRITPALVSRADARPQPEGATRQPITPAVS